MIWETRYSLIDVKGSTFYITFYKVYDQIKKPSDINSNSLPGLWDCSRLKIPENWTWRSMYFEDPNAVFLRKEQEATLLHQPPPCIYKYQMNPLHFYHE